MSYQIVTIGGYYPLGKKDHGGKKSGVDTIWENHDHIAIFERALPRTNGLDHSTSLVLTMALLPCF